MARGGQPAPCQNLEASQLLLTSLMAILCVHHRGGHLNRLFIPTYIWAYMRSNCPPRLHSLSAEGLLICVRLRRRSFSWPITQHHKINGTTGFLYYLQLLSGPDKVHFPTYFVPYLPHSCILTDCATMLPEIDSLLLLVSVSYDSCKPLLDYAPMEHPSMLQI